MHLVGFIVKKFVTMHGHTNVKKYTCILLNHHFINTIRNSSMFHPLKVHLHGVQLIHSSSVSQQNDPPFVKFW
jgi:hypothetical protein